MKFSRSKLAAVGAVALSALVFAPAQAAPTYTATLGFNGQVIADSCAITVAPLGVTLPFNALNGLTLPLPVGIQTKASFDEASGLATSRNVFSLAISGCPSSVSSIDFAFTQATSSWANGGTGGVLENYAGGSNPSADVGVRLTKFTGGAWSPIDLTQAISITLDNTGSSTSPFKMGYQFYDYDTSNSGPQPGQVKTNVGLTVTYQ